VGGSSDGSSSFGCGRLFAFTAGSGRDEDNRDSDHRDLDATVVVVGVVVVVEFVLLRGLASGSIVPVASFGAAAAAAVGAPPSSSSGRFVAKGGDVDDIGPLPKGGNEEGGEERPMEAE
jgi:hypothetical protein